jgi:hypothetical protein
MNKLIFIALIILVVVIVYGYSRIINWVEVDTGHNNCRNTTSGANILTKAMIDMLCDEHCTPGVYTFRHGHFYNNWKCSDADTIVCVCNR